METWKSHIAVSFNLHFTFFCGGTREMMMMLWWCFDDKNENCLLNTLFHSFIRSFGLKIVFRVVITILIFLFITLIEKLLYFSLESNLWSGSPLFHDDDDGFLFIVRTCVYLNNSIYNVTSWSFHYIWINNATTMMMMMMMLNASEKDREQQQQK